MDTPLHRACAPEHPNLQEIKDLLDGGADVNAAGHMESTPIDYATRNVNLEVMALLFEYDANPNIPDGIGIFPLHYATDLDDDIGAKVVEMLLLHGADIRAQIYDGSTALHNAAENGRVKIVEVLLKHGASLEIKDDEGRIPLNVASTDEIRSMLDDTPVIKEPEKQ